LPITKSAKKSLKVSRTKKVGNDAYRKNLEIALKKVDAKNVSSVISLIDKTAKVGVIAKGKAARMKSQLTKKFGTPARHASLQGVAGRPKVTKKVVAKPVAKKPVTPLVMQKAVAKKETVEKAATKKPAVKKIIAIK